MPSLDGLAQELQPRGLTLLLVNLREGRDVVARTVAAQGYRAPGVLDVDGRVAGTYGVTATPTVFVIGREGFVLGRAIGRRPWAETEGRALLAEILAAPARRR